MLKHEELLLMARVDEQLNQGMQLAKPGDKALKEACSTQLTDQSAGLMTVKDRVKELQATHSKGRAQVFAQMEKLKQQHLSPTLRKLCAGYEMRVYWFELFECARKISLVAVPIFFKAYPTTQLTLGLIVCFITYGSYSSFAPFVKDDEDFLQVVAQFSIFFSLVSSIVLKTNPDSQAMAVLMLIMLLVPPLIALSNQVKNAFRSIFKPCINALAKLAPRRLNWLHQGKIPWLHASALPKPIGAKQQNADTSGLSA